MIVNFDADGLMAAGNPFNIKGESYWLKEELKAGIVQRQERKD